MREAVQRAWLRRGTLAWALWPLSLVFGALGALRRMAYRIGMLRVDRMPVPVIVVGNVVAGGSGKTPVVQAIVRHLQQQGLRVGVVSRGYGRRTHDCREVHATDDARDTGDEPLLIARSCGVPVVVGAARAQAARELLHAHPDTQVIVSDDGLQHLALARDVEICVFDARGAGNGWLLPAGPLREPWPRKVDLIVGPGGHEVLRALAPHAVRADGTHLSLSRLPANITALAGIAQPEAFFAMLRRAGVQVGRTVALPDHHDFAHPLDVTGDIVCTEKDAVKLWATHPHAWSAPLVVRIGPAFWTALDAKLAAVRASRISSPHGSQTP